ncbi:hypothetical protein ES703_43710 [subsurface metagenome]
MIILIYLIIQNYHNELINTCQVFFFDGQEYLT